MKRAITNKKPTRAKKRKEYKENLTGSRTSTQRGKLKSKVKYKNPATTIIYLYLSTPTTSTYTLTYNYNMSTNANTTKRPRQSNDKSFDPREEAKKPAKKTKPGPAVAPKPKAQGCLLYTSPSPRDRQKSRMPSSA